MEVKSEKINTESIPFSLAKQRAVLGHTLYDEDFFNIVVARLEPDWFADPEVSRIFKAVKEWYQKWHKKPTAQELMESPGIVSRSPAELRIIQGIISLVQKERENFYPTPLLSEMEVWMKTRLLQLALPKASNAYNKQNIDGAVQVLNSMIKDFHEVKFLEDGQEFFENYGAEFIAKKEQNRKRAITFGLRDMDRLIDKECTSQGSMLAGDMTVLLAPTNVGKTSIMVTVATANILQGKSVLFLNHEGRVDDIKYKFMRCITGMTGGQLEKGYMDPAIAPKLAMWEKILDRFLVYVPMSRPGLTVEEVSVVVEQYQDKRRMLNGKGFDLMVDDYPAKLTTAKAKGGRYQKREEHEEIYNYFTQMALYHDFHVLTAVQTNREGSRVNRKVGQHKNETRLLHMEDVHEAFGVMQTAANVVSANRTDEDASSNKITYLLCKSRTGETGWAVTANTNYDACKIHSEELGCFWYRGSHHIGDIASELMQGYKNREVDGEKIRKLRDVG